MASAAQVVLLIEGRDAASGVIRGVQTSAQGLGGTLGKVGQIAGGFLAANVIQSGASAFTGFLSDSISAASDLGESINAVNQIFDKNADTILKWGKDSATSFGLSQRAFNQMATPMGAVLKNLDFSTEEVADQTIELTKRAADMASVFNTDVEDALAAINSALRGEANPIERYGVSVNQTAVNLRALADTGKESAAQLTENEKAAARLALIFEQTAAVAGDFQNTSDQLANAQRIQAARQEELQAQIGEKLLPLQLKFTEAKLAFVDLLATKVIPKLEELYARHWPAIQEAIEKVAAFIEEVWPTVSEILAFGVDFVIAKVEGFVRAFGGIIDIVTGVVDFVKAVAAGDWAAAWDAVVQVAQGFLDLLLGYVAFIWGNIPQTILGLAGRASDAARSFAQSVFNAFVAWLEQLPGRVASIVEDVIKALNPLNQASGILGVDVNPFGGILGNDDGGIVPGPRGAPRLVVAHGGEEFLPTHGGAGRGAGGEMTIQFIGPVSLQAGSIQTAMDDVAFALDSALRSRGIR